MWRPGVAILLALALTVPCVEGTAPAHDYICCPTCTGSLSSTSATTLVISTVIDSITFESPTLLSEILITNQRVIVTFASGPPALVTIPDGLLTLGPLLPAAALFDGLSWTTTQAIGIGSAKLSTPTFVAAGAYNLPAKAVVTSASYCADYTATLGPAIKSLQWNITERLYKPALKTGIFLGLKGLPFGVSGVSAGLVLDTACAPAGAAVACGPFTYSKYLCPSPPPPSPPPPSPPPPSPPPPPPPSPPPPSPPPPSPPPPPPPSPPPPSPPPPSPPPPSPPPPPPPSPPPPLPPPSPSPPSPPSPPPPPPPSPSPPPPSPSPPPPSPPPPFPPPMLVPGLLLQEYRYSGSTATCVIPLETAASQAAHSFVFADVDGEVPRSGNTTVSTVSHSTGAAGVPGNFAKRYSGFFDAVATSTYEFTLTSDDGSYLWLDGNSSYFINNSAMASTVPCGYQGNSSNSTTATLQAGLHQLVIDYFNAPGSATTTVLTITDTVSHIDYSSSFVHDSLGPCNSDCAPGSCNAAQQYCMACSSGAAPVGGVCPSPLNAPT